MLISSVQSPPPRTGANTTVASVSTNVIPSGYTAIYSAEDLNNVRNKLDGKYILMNDIDLSSIDNWDPIADGSAGSYFTGIFDGNGHVIKNLTINRPDKNNIGLFGYIGTSSSTVEIKNLGLENVNINGKDNVGGLVGFARDGKISKCYVTGNISGNEYVGGLVGSCQDTITNCYVTGNVSGSRFIGGLAGEITREISNSYTSCNVSSTKDSGYLISGSTYHNADIINVWADKKDSNLQAFYGGMPSNSGSVEHSEFTSHEFWDKQNFASDIWEMSYSIPPVLKDIGGQEINWYFQRGNNDFRLQVGEGSDPAANALFVNTGLDLGAINIDLSTVEGCLDASRCAKAALDAVTKKTADIGISQSRLETISNVNTTQIENLSAAYSTVTEADVAEEVANYTKAQIMAQAASSLMTQTQAFQANLLLRMISSLG